MAVLSGRSPSPRRALAGGVALLFGCAAAGAASVYAELYLFFVGLTLLFSDEHLTRGLVASGLTAGALGGVVAAASFALALRPILSRPARWFFGVWSGWAILGAAAFARGPGAAFLVGGGLAAATAALGLGLSVASLRARG